MGRPTTTLHGEISIPSHERELYQAAAYRRRDESPLRYTLLMGKSTKKVR